MYEIFQNSPFHYSHGIVFYGCEENPHDASMRCQDVRATNYNSFITHDHVCEYENYVVFYWGEETYRELKKLDIEVLNFYVENRLLNNTYLNTYFENTPDCVETNPNVISISYHEPYRPRYPYQVKCENNRELFSGYISLSPEKKCKAVELEWNHTLVL